jgi:hypothetical protein
MASKYGDDERAAILAEGYATLERLERMHQERVMTQSGRRWTPTCSLLDALRFD